MKRLLCAVAGIVLVGLGGILLAVFFFSADTLRDSLEQKVLERTGRPLRMVAAPRLSLVPLGVSFGALRWGEAEGNSVAVGGGAVYLNILPLLLGRVEVAEIRLDRPVVFWKEAPADAASGGTGGAPAVVPPALERLSLVNGSLHLEKNDGAVFQADKFNALVTNLKAGAEAVVQLDFVFQARQPDLAANLSLVTRMRLSDTRWEWRQGSLTATPLRGPLPAAAGPVRLLLDGFWDKPTGRVEGLVKLTMAGLRANFSGHVLLRPLALEGRVRLDAVPRALAGIWGVSLPERGDAPSLALETPLVLRHGQWRCDALEGTLDGAPVQGALTLDMGETPALQGALRAGRVVLDAWLPESSPDAGPPGGEDAARERSIFPGVDLDLHVASLQMAAGRLGGLRVRIQGADGRYIARPLILEPETGSVSAVLETDLRSRRHALRGEAAAVRVAPLWQALRGDAPVDARAFLRLDLTCVGDSAPACARSLSGSGVLTLRDMVLRGVSLVPGGLPLPSGVTGTRFDLLEAPFAVRNGTATVTPLRLVSPAVGARGQAVVNIPGQRLDAVATFDVMGVRIPVAARGPFSRIVYGLDSRQELPRLLPRSGGGTPGRLPDLDDMRNFLKR